MTTTIQVPGTSLPASVIGRLADLAVEVGYAPGAVILRDAELVPFLGRIEAGRVGLRINVPGRGDQTVVTLEPAELLGWSALVPPYRATAEAVAFAPTRLVTWEANALRARLAAEPDLAAELLPAVLAGLSERLTTSWNQLLDLFSPQVGEPW
jgi:CRP/FNR family transcriptional regulator, cyclic AMP receptor protein